MSLELKTIDEIIRTKSTFDGLERIAGRDSEGDFKALIASIGTYMETGARILELDDADHTILDTEIYNEYIFKNLTEDRVLYFPTLADNYGRKFSVKNLSGDYSVLCIPEGSENINDWNYQFKITEKGGNLDCIGLTTHWECTPSDNCCIYYVESETVDSGLSVDGTWDDVEGMELLDGVYGKGFLSAYGEQLLQEITPYSEYFRSFFGLSTVSGHNTPNILVNEKRHQIGTDNFRIMQSLRQIIDHPYVSDGSKVYMKSRGDSSSLPLYTHRMYGATNNPMYIKFRRTY